MRLSCPASRQRCFPQLRSMAAVNTTTPMAEGAAVRDPSATAVATYTDTAAGGHGLSAYNQGCAQVDKPPPPPPPQSVRTPNTRCLMRARLPRVVLRNRIIDNVQWTGRVSRTAHAGRQRLRRQLKRRLVLLLRGLWVRTVPWRVRAHAILSSIRSGSLRVHPPLRGVQIAFGRQPWRVEQGDGLRPPLRATVSCADWRCPRGRLAQLNQSRPSRSAVRTRDSPSGQPSRIPCTLGRPIKPPPAPGSFAGPPLPPTRGAPRLIFCGFPYLVQSCVFLLYASSAQPGRPLGRVDCVPWRRHVTYIKPVHSIRPRTVDGKPPHRVGRLAYTSLSRTRPRPGTSGASADHRVQILGEGFSSTARPGRAFGLLVSVGFGPAAFGDFGGFRGIRWLRAGGVGCGRVSGISNLGAVLGANRVPLAFHVPHARKRCFAWPAAVGVCLWARNTPTSAFLIEVAPARDRPLRRQRAAPFAPTASSTSGLFYPRYPPGSMSPIAEVGSGRPAPGGRRDAAGRSASTGALRGSVTYWPPAPVSGPCFVRAREPA